MSKLPVEPGPFAKLLNSPADFERVLGSLEHTILASFEIDARLTGEQPRVTELEIKRRFEICERWFRIMRLDYGFGLVRTLDCIPKALACELIGQSFDPKDYQQDYNVAAMRRGPV